MINTTLPDSIAEIVSLAQKAADARIITVNDPLTGLTVPILQRALTAGGVDVSGVKKYVDEWREFPERRSGLARIATLPSFVAFALRHADEDSVLFAQLDGDKPSLLAVFDYHKLDHAPRNGKHRALYEFPLSPEFLAWKASDAKPMGQGEWAAFVEEHIAELATPHDDERKHFEALFQTKIATPAELITLSRGLAISVEAKVRDFRVLQSGETEISYEEVHRDGTGQKLVVPGLFMVRAPLFIGGEPQRLIARLRYRKSNNSVAWFYQLYRAQAAVREAMARDAAGASAATSLPLFEGAPEA